MFLLLVAKMDIDREIVSVQAENVDGAGSFDDILVKTKNGSKFRFQIRHSINLQSFSLGEGSLEYNGSHLELSEDAANILVMDNCPDVVETDAVFGIPAQQFGNSFVINLAADTLANMLDDLYLNEQRLLQIIHSVNDLQFYLTAESLPPFRLFSSELQEKTVQIRNFAIQDSKGVLTIYGKPGVGKSHLVNQMDVGERRRILYRCWVSQQDENKGNRRMFRNFLADISFQMFNDARPRTEDEFIAEWKDTDAVLILDGLDHVENYAIAEMEAFLRLINRVEEEKTNQLIVFSRPLLPTHVVNGMSQEIGNWTQEETVRYLEGKHSIAYNIATQIYEISDGYPIITEFVAREYLESGNVRLANQVTTITEYYDSLLTTQSIRPMRIFSCVSCYLTIV